MTMRIDRWEHGSDFHEQLSPNDLEAVATAWWAEGAQLLGSGRDAMRFVLRLGKERHGWRRLLVPDYFCQEVVAALAAEMPTGTYPCNPWQDVGLPRGLTGDDVVLTLPYFGHQPPPRLEARAGRSHWVIEDHTHDPTSPWAVATRADYCVASLRKTLPIPEGGIAWSPSFMLPPAPGCTPARERAASAKRSAMWLKAGYLAGAGVEKAVYRELALEGEASIASGDVSGMTRATRQVLPLLPVAALRDARKQNHRRMLELLQELPWVSPLELHSEAVPSAFVLRTDTHERREQVRTRLIASRVYPAILWSLDHPVVDVSAMAKEVARTLLVLHCDARYGAPDLDRVARLVREAGEE